MEIAMFKKLHHVAYRCEDARATADFYSKVLGLKFAAAVNADAVASIRKHDPHTHIFFEMGDGSYIAFFELLDKSAPHVPVANDWAQHLALEVKDQQVADALLARLREHGVQVVGPEPHGGLINSWYFFDPSGHRLEIVVRTAGKDVWDKLGSKAEATLDDWQKRKA
jgi:catechol 2,3-dioxygenase-like lactoylglutathione lyase family enzyme